MGEEPAEQELSAFFDDQRPSGSEVESVSFEGEPVLPGGCGPAFEVCESIGLANGGL